MMDFLVTHNQQELDHFLNLQAATFSQTSQYNEAMWDKRARHWEAQRQRQTRGDERVPVTMEYLTGRGVLTPERIVADIGCGPGRFVAAFAEIARAVEGFDLSAEMVANGKAHLERLHRSNATITQCDFEALDIYGAGLAGKFDLVFSSMTPAVHSRQGLANSMAMSRKWCCNISHLHRENHLQNRMRREVFGLEPRNRQQGRVFYSLFNTLFLLGYQPETSFANRRKERLAEPDEEFVEYLLEHGLDWADHTPEAARAIARWLDTQRNEDGLVLEQSDAVYGRILWDVTQRFQRPDYGIGG